MGNGAVSDFQPPPAALSAAALVAAAATATATATATASMAVLQEQQNQQQQHHSHQQQMNMNMNMSINNQYGPPPNQVRNDNGTLAVHFGTCSNRELASFLSSLCYYSPMIAQKIYWELIPHPFVV
jgi:hypothetical protein